jgi:hypothetical protein
MAEFDPSHFSDIRAENLHRVSALLSRYEASFNRLMQLKTKQRLTQTNFLSS